MFRSILPVSLIALVCLTTAGEQTADATTIYGPPVGAWVSGAPVYIWGSPIPNNGKPVTVEFDYRLVGSGFSSGNVLVAVVNPMIPPAGAMYPPTTIANASLSPKHFKQTYPSSYSPTLVDIGGYTKGSNARVFISNIRITY